jgi:PAS domain S-box-containing protein
MARELARMRARLAESEETLRAIRDGSADAIVVAGEHGSRVFSLDAVGNAYRVLIESMNEGALILARNETILYANQSFATLVDSPLEKVIGSSLRGFLSTDDRATLRPLLERSGKSGAKLQVQLRGARGSSVPVQISLRPLPENGFMRPTIGVIVTDMTLARRNEELLRKLSSRLVQAQETERGRLAGELHDHVTQLLCAILFRFQALADKLSLREGPFKGEAKKLREMLGEGAEAVERISSTLRPATLNDLGLVAVLRAASAEFTLRSGVPVTLSCATLKARLPSEIELTLYRIAQEALDNVARHARAKHVTLELKVTRAVVRLSVHDDGVGFDSNRLSHERRGRIGLGLLGMRERATFVGGTLEINSTRQTGTQIDVHIPRRPPTKAGVPA